MESRAYPKKGLTLYDLYLTYRKSPNANAMAEQRRTIVPNRSRRALVEQSRTIVPNRSRKALVDCVAGTMGTIVLP